MKTMLLAIEQGREQNSDFGAGWLLDGVAKLHLNTDSAASITFGSGQTDTDGRGNITNRRYTVGEEKSVINLFVKVCLNAVLVILMAVMGVASKEAVSATPVELFNEGTTNWFGLEHSKDCVRTCDLFEKSAASNYKEAQYNLGDCYRLGKGRGEDIYKALYWYQKSTDNGYVDAKVAFLAAVITEIKDKTRYYKKVTEYIGAITTAVI